MWIWSTARWQLRAPSCTICWWFNAALWQRSTKWWLDGYLWCSPCQRSSLRPLWQSNRHQNSISLHHLFTDIRAVIWYGLPIKSGGLKFTLPSRDALDSALIKMWWMKAVKHQLYEVCQGPTTQSSQGCEKFSQSKHQRWSFNQG